MSATIADLVQKVAHAFNSGDEVDVTAISAINLQTLVLLNRMKFDLSKENLVVLRSAIEKITIAAIVHGSPELFVDCANTFRGLLIDAGHHLMHPDTCTDDTIEVIVLLQCYFLVSQDLASFELFSSIIKQTEDATFVTVRNASENLQTIEALHTSLMTGSLEASLSLIEKAQLGSKNEGFARLTHQLGDTTREVISASIEQSHTDLSVDKVLAYLHFSDVVELEAWMAKRVEARRAYLEGMAITTDDTAIAMQGGSVPCTSALSKQLRHADIVADNAQGVTEDVAWLLDTSTGTLVFSKKVATSDEEMKNHDPFAAKNRDVNVDELFRLRKLFACGEFLESAF